MKRLACALLLAFPLLLRAQTGMIVTLDDGWRFTPGDSIAYAAPAFDDSRWVPVKVDRIWEAQGYEKLDGFAWYRLRFQLPLAMRDSARLRDGLRFFLGKINNFDLTYLNGGLIGVNDTVVPPGTRPDTAYLKADVGLWNVARTYVLPADDPRIAWGKENVLAVRVFDAGGEGGMYTGGQSVRMMTLGDYLVIDTRSEPFRFAGHDLSKTFTLKNVSPVHTLHGSLTIVVRNKVSGEGIRHEVRDPAGQPPGGVMDSSHDVREVTLAPLASRDFTLKIGGLDQSARVTYDFVIADGAGHSGAAEETPYILTPLPPESPRINGPAVTGTRPGRPFLYAVPVSGVRPMTFSAEDLPPGLSINPATGIIAGRIKNRGDYPVTLTASNARGKASRTLRIVAGDKVALTPPLGWNSWNCWGLSVDRSKVIASAKSFKAKGLVDHGWQYINIDDGWEIVGTSAEPKREKNGDIRTNAKFPDMKALGDTLHALGLRFGIYSSPGPLTCGGYTASYGFERNDARSYARWGVDYLKYDWCSYEKIAKDTSLPELKAPYLLMRKMLDEVDRDIVFSLCQYGMGNVWEWGAEVGGNLWRTTGDITDTWESMSSIGFNQLADGRFAGPGHWNDPDMLVVGWVGWGPSLHPSGLTPDEQYTHISLWCMLSAPLLIGCDLNRLDDFTLNLLANDEVLAVDQDPLGKQAVPAVTAGDIQVWTKPLADGGKAIGVFNTGKNTAPFTLELSRLGVQGSLPLRDLWRQKEVRSSGGTVDLRVPSHGVVLLKAGVASR
ncbi:MAG TPA: putative Ig domain-containing protein [Bacteroidota bacterium]|nr:putative Ig domain-containing protein [Bacteroidota bacterium]